MHTLLPLSAVGLDKQDSFAAACTRLYHYQTSSGQEVDFIPESSRGEIVGIEVKSTSRVSSRDFRHLEVLKSEINEKFKCGIVVHPGKNAVPFGDQLYALPLASLWQRILTQKEGQIKPATKLNEVPPSVIDRPIEFPPGSFSGLTL